MLHIKLFENYISGKIELIPVEVAPQYRAFDIHINNKKEGIIDVGFYNDDLKDDEAEIVGININKENRGRGIGKLAVQQLFKEFPTINGFIVMPTEDSMGFWKRLGTKPHMNGYLYLRR